MQVLLSGSPATGEAVRPRTRARLLQGPLLTLAVGLCAALPVIAAAVRGLNEGWQPVADRGIIATRAFDVFSSHMPLVGQYSFAGTVTGKLTYSLGPLLYWMLAPAAHIGAPGSFVLTTAIVNSACILGAVALARRRGGIWLMVAAAVGIGLMCRSLAANNFYDIWNPSAGLFPLLALMFCCWSLACGEYRLLPVTLLLASFEMQCEDSFIPTSLGALAVGIVGLAIWWFHTRRELPRERRRAVVGWVAAGVLVLAVCWSAPLVDQVGRSGNFGLVVQAAGKRKAPLGSTVGLRAVIRTVGVVPWWLKREPEPFVRKFDVRHPASTITDLTAALVLGWLVAAIAIAVRRRRGDVVAGAATALMLCAGIYSIASATPRTPLLAATLGYTLWSASTVGMFAWLVALWSAVTLSGADAAIARAGARRLASERSREAGLGAGAAALVALAAVLIAALAGGAGASAGAPDEHAFEFAGLGKLNARLGAVPRGHSVFLNARLDGLITPLRPELTYDLRRRGVRALGNGAYLRTGHWYERSEHPYDYVVWVYDNGRLPVPGARVIAEAKIRSGGRPHSVWVALSRAPPGTSRAGRAAAARAALVPPQGTLHAGGWSAAALPAGCPALRPAIAFPSEGPASPTGNGALVWSARGPACSGGTASLVLAPLGAGERLGPASATQADVSGLGELQAVGASFGRIAIAVLPGGLAQAPLVFQARAGSAPRAPLMRGAAGAPLALARAYLGDAAVATVVPGPAIAVRVERFFRHDFAPPRLIRIAPGAVSALTVTLDYRSDALVAWQQNGAIYAHMLRASGRVDPTQRVGASAPGPQLRALVSDNDHGMLAWTSTAPAGAAVANTRVNVALSSAGVRFRAPRLLASFADPLLAGRADGSLRLVRLSSENVLLAWTDRERGRYAVRAAPAVFAGTRPSVRLSAASADGVLADLAPGPAGEALAAWRSSPLGTGAGLQPAQLWAARVFIGPGDRPGFTGAQALPGGGRVSAASAGIDPASDRPVVAWLQSGGLRYAVGPPDVGYRPHAPGSPPAAQGGTHWLRVTLAAVAALTLLLALGALLTRRRRRLALSGRR